MRPRPLQLFASAILLSVHARALATVPGSHSSPAPQSDLPRIMQIESPGSVAKADQPAVFEEYVLAFRGAVSSHNEARERELAEHASAVFPEFRRPWCHLAAARLRLHQWGPAIEAARTAEKARDDPFAPSALPEEGVAGAAYWEGLALYQTQRFDEALPRLRVATARAPQWAEAARALGEAEFVAGHSKAAVAAYGAAFDLDPNIGNVQDLSYWAEARATNGDVEGGIASLQEALRRSPYEPGLHAKLGDLLRREGKPVEAYYELVLEGLLQGTQGRFTPPAVSMAQNIVDAIRRDPEASRQDHELLVISAGLASLDAGEPHLAIHQLRHALEVGRTASPVPRLLLGDALYRDGQFEPSRAVLEEILATDPDMVPALELLSKVYTKLGRPRDADLAEQRAHALFPTYWKLQSSKGRS